MSLEDLALSKHFRYLDTDWEAAAIATIFMDVESLQAEAAMEVGDADAVEQVVARS